MYKIIPAALCCSLLSFSNEKQQNKLLPAQKSITAEKNSPLPKIFAENIISTDEDEIGSGFTPDGKTVFFTKKSPSTIGSAVMMICFSELKNSKWQTPQAAPFSGHYKDFNPFVSPDGNTLFFVSFRPVDGKQHGTDIWFVKKTGNTWSEPKNIGAPINSDGWELGCSATTDGTLYFSSTGKGYNADLYCSRFVDGKYQQPEKLDSAINSDFDETDPFIAPDESYLIFASTGRTDGLKANGAVYPRGDLYISFKKDGKWTPAKNLGAPVNSDADESNPYVSHDGKTLFFSSERGFAKLPMPKSFTYEDLEKHLHSAANGLGDIYEIPFDEVLKK
jgi:hypothetical protein